MRELEFLGKDGSISIPNFFVWNGSNAAAELLPSEAESTASDSYVRNAIKEKFKEVVPCKDSMQDYIPPRELKQGMKLCVVMVPPHYLRPFKWPQSQNKARVQNVANSPLLKAKQSRAWVHVNASTVFFLPGGPNYLNGVDSYLDHISKLVPELGIGSIIRVALDFNCGTGSFSWALGKRGVTSLCLAAYGSSEEGVQLVMERGYPAMLTHSFVSRFRLPYPCQAFDLLHCAACNISWLSNDGALLFEADRILRQGGFFVWIMDASNHGITWSDMATQTEKLCWNLITRNNQLAVWRKPGYMTSASCKLHTHVPCCLSPPISNSTWEVVMKPCLETTRSALLTANVHWKSRLINPPKRLEFVPTAGLHRAKKEVFLSDFNYWAYLTDIYVRIFGVSRVLEIRNVLDANAGYGSFAAAMALKMPPVPWVVLNVMPVDQPDRLPVIFDRGLLGVYHDWCEPFDSYPRTFDLIHASRLFSSQNRCSMQVILQEMDRLLRPGGFALFRDHKKVLLPLQKVAQALHWKAHIEDTESGTWGTEKFLHCQKTRWTIATKTIH
ncbi:probable methyltransferase PMT12 isoform X3 [Physcomitrium patens]|nr:probable methyltransferase PMT12 isoform X2 [Physcomitrium patens]|eukprot:XP_024363734.1 probable methyltransferase PMT12 isoform X2 [Physcomitrella patens]